MGDTYGDMPVVYASCVPSVWLVTASCANMKTSTVYLIHPTLTVRVIAEGKWT